ncbi:DsbA family protein [Sphingoaurantiacus capsulatus]|uniref:DsbA family protein n=1 Tax=Sphingoaurantiacus capsulatus TaxID=1771310 RepID=A0ABV7XAK6_9SPHN
MTKDFGGLVAAAKARIAQFGLWEWAAMGAVILAAAAGLAIAAGSSSPAPAGADQFSKAQREAIDAMVRDYILKNPEIIPEAINRLQDREVEKLLDSNRAEIEKPFAGAWAGNPDGDIVMVEFFDYACPYCRASKADVERLLKDDQNLKVVYRDFPILGPASDEAAMASLSAAKQGRYKPFHDAMFAAGRPSHEKVVATVRKAGLNERQTASDITSTALKTEINKNLDLGRALGLTGTPAYVVGNRILSGSVGYDEMKKAIAEARAAR